MSGVVSAVSECAEHPRAAPRSHRMDDSRVPLGYTGSRSHAGDVAFFVALVATGLALGAALAHALELPAKMQLDKQSYFIAQQLYAGWDRLGFLLAVELLGQFAVIAIYRHRRRVARPAVMAMAALLAAQGVFWAFTFPMNRATADWTVQPANWEALRYQWEYSHLAGAACQLLSFVALCVALLMRRDDPAPG